jgi:hypothetical protein
MSTLSRFRPDEFTIAMLATGMLSLLLPCQGTSAVVFEWLAGAAIVLLFFLQGARLSRPAILAGALHWRLHFLVFTASPRPALRERAENWFAAPPSLARLQLALNMTNLPAVHNTRPNVAKLRKISAL